MNNQQTQIQQTSKTPHNKRQLTNINNLQTTNNKQQQTNNGQHSTNI